MRLLLNAAVLSAVAGLAGCASAAGTAGPQGSPATGSRPPTAGPAATAPATANSGGGLAASACNVSTAQVVAVMGPAVSVTDKQAGPSHVCTWKGRKNPAKPAVLTFIVAVGPAAQYDALAPKAEDHPRAVPGFDRAQAWVVTSFGQYTGYLLAARGDRSVFLDVGTLTEPSVAALAAIAHAALR